MTSMWPQPPDEERGRPGRSAQPDRGLAPERRRTPRGEAELGTDGPGAIVVGVDGTPTSLRALAYAAGLARRQRAELIVVYVRSPLRTPVALSGWVDAGIVAAETQAQHDVEDEVLGAGHRRREHLGHRRPHRDPGRQPAARTQEGGRTVRRRHDHRRGVGGPRAPAVRFAGAPAAAPQALPRHHRPLSRPLVGSSTPRRPAPGSSSPATSRTARPATAPTPSTSPDHADPGAGPAGPGGPGTHVARWPGVGPRPVVL